jgi:hypothetical protein
MSASSWPGRTPASSAQATAGNDISGGGGYIAAGVIAQDLDLPAWWQPVDARASLMKLADHG